MLPAGGFGTAGVLYVWSYPRIDCTEVQGRVFNDHAQGAGYGSSDLRAVALRPVHPSGEPRGHATMGDAPGEAGAVKGERRGSDNRTELLCGVRS